MRWKGIFYSTDYNECWQEFEIVRWHLVVLMSREMEVDSMRDSIGGLDLLGIIRLN